MAGKRRVMWSRAPFGRALLNSVLVASTITAAVLVLGSMTAYAMARLTFPGRRACTPPRWRCCSSPGN